MRTRPTPTRRRGVLLVMTLVVLVLVAILAAAFTAGLVNARRRALLAERGAQARLLADAGAARARARLARDPAYEGETWSIPAGELGGPDAATVVVAIEKRPGPDASCRVHVVA